MNVSRNKNPLLSCAVTGGFDELAGSGIVLAAAEKPVFTIGAPAISDTDNFSDVSLDRDVASDSTGPQVDAFVSPLAELDSMENLQHISSVPTLNLNQDQQPIDANLNPISAALAQLPSAASTVFSTFSNIIKGSQSQPRFDQQPQTTPLMEPMSESVNPTGYMMMPSFDPNAPPPAFFSPADDSLFKKLNVEPATSNTFRLGGNKKKTYAHIPGLSSHQQGPAVQNFNANPMIPPMPPQREPTAEPNNSNRYYQEYQAPQPVYNQPQREPEKSNKFSLTSLLPSQLLEKIPSTKNLFGSSEPTTQYEPQPFNGNQDFSVMTSAFDQPPQPSNYFNAPPQNAMPFSAVSEPQNIDQMPLPPVSYFNPQQFNTNPFMQQAQQEPAAQLAVTQVAAPPMMPPMAIPAHPVVVAPPAAAPFNQTMFKPAPISCVANEPPQIAAVSADTNLPPPTFFNPVEATQMFNTSPNDGKPKNPYSSSRISRGVGMYKTRANSDAGSNQAGMTPPVTNFSQSSNAQFAPPAPKQQKIPSRPLSIPPLPTANYEVTQSDPSLNANLSQHFQTAVVQPPPATSHFFNQTQSQPPMQMFEDQPMNLAPERPMQLQPPVQLFQEPPVPGRKKSDLNMPEVSHTPPTFSTPPKASQVDGNASIQNFYLPSPVNQVFEAPSQVESIAKPDMFTPDINKSQTSDFQPKPIGFERTAKAEQEIKNVTSFFRAPQAVEAKSAQTFFDPTPISKSDNASTSDLNTSYASSNASTVNFFQAPVHIENLPTAVENDAPVQQFFKPSQAPASEAMSVAGSLAPQMGSVVSQPRYFDSPRSMSVVSDADSNSAIPPSSAVSLLQSTMPTQEEFFTQSNSRSNSSAAPSVNFFNPETSATETPIVSLIADTTPNDFFLDESVVSPIEAAKLREEPDDASVYSTSILTSNNETVTEVYDKLDSMSMSENIGSTLSLFATSELDLSSIQKPTLFESLVPKFLDTQVAAPRSTSSPALVKPYRAVYRHWFYQNLYWHPFAMSDSLGLDEAIATGNEIVLTDGGKFEVNLRDRRRSSIYWTSGTNAIRRCSWFFKNPEGNEQNLIPFDEQTADFMEAEYEKAVLNNTWSHRLQIPGSDDFLTFRDATNIEFCQMGQALVVKRGVDEFVIDDGEEAAIDHLIVSVSNFGDKIDDSADELRLKCSETMQHYYSDAVDCGQIGRVEVLPISLNSINVLKVKESNMTIETAPGGNSELPASTAYQDIIMKTSFYCHHEYYQNIMNHLAFSLNDIVTKFLQRNANYKGKISLIATSFEALFLFDLLHNQDEGPEFWRLSFDVSNFYAFGMPSNLLTIRNSEMFRRPHFDLKTCKKFFNVVHRLDPIAQRIEPLVQPESTKLAPESIENESPDRFDFTIADGSSLESFSLKNYFTSELIILRIASEIYGSFKMDSGSL